LIYSWSAYDLDYDGGSCAIGGGEVGDKLASQFRTMLALQNLAISLAT